jgi:hypothetical protein
MIEKAYKKQQKTLTLQHKFAMFTTQKQQMTMQDILARYAVLIT